MLSSSPAHKKAGTSGCWLPEAWETAGQSPVGCASGWKTWVCGSETACSAGWCRHPRGQCCWRCQCHSARSRAQVKPVGHWEWSPWHVGCQSHHRWDRGFLFLWYQVWGSPQAASWLSCHHHKVGCCQGHQTPHSHFLSSSFPLFSSPALGPLTSSPGTGCREWGWGPAVPALSHNRPQLPAQPRGAETTQQGVGMAGTHSCCWGPLCRRDQGHRRPPDMPPLSHTSVPRTTQGSCRWSWPVAQARSCHHFDRGWRHKHLVGHTGRCTTGWCTSAHPSRDCWHRRWGHGSPSWLRGLFWKGWPGCACQRRGGSPHHTWCRKCSRQILREKAAVTLGFLSRTRLSKSCLWPELLM